MQASRVTSNQKHKHGRDFVMRTPLRLPFATLLLLVWTSGLGLMFPGPTRASVTSLSLSLSSWSSSGTTSESVGTRAGMYPVFLLFFSLPSFLEASVGVGGG